LSFSFDGAPRLRFQPGRVRRCGGAAEAFSERLPILPPSLKEADSEKESANVGEFFVDCEIGLAGFGK
jgi:hypothetical protein